ncbi:unnamed protein product [Dibothriocephalus latus]|uniref:Tetraspanin n=1 Tax=Dibothriocephalus latus TaxID=60516 RepID=A0A3P7LHC3_DIBLA|nr:unnamed protein product [Dibothriocephalus latus]
MGCDAPTCLKFLLFIFNLVLTFLFLLLAIFGFLIRFSPRIVIAYMQQLLDEAVPEANAENLAKFFMENDLPIALTLIIVGICCALFCFLGALAACCGCRGVLKFHAAILALLIIASSIATGVVFGTNESLQNTVDALMMRTLQGAYVDQTANSPGTYVWYLIMTKDNVTCCGMNGYTDFGSKSPSCCFMLI